MKNINWTNGTAAANAFNCIAIVGVGVSATGNTIGDASTGSISFTPFAGGSFYGFNISNSGGGTVDCSSNTIGSITTTTNKANVYGIWSNLLTSGVTTGTNIVSANTIGSLTTAGSISLANVVDNVVYGIRVTNQGTNTVTRNIIANIVNGSATGSALNGIKIENGTTTVNGNYICKLTLPNNTAGSSLKGIAIDNASNAVAATSTYSNNIISLGDNTQTGFLGIHEINAQGASTTNLYHNTIYIGGTQATGAGPFSYALRSNNSTTFNKNIKNNILVNARSGGSVDHLALNAAAPAAGGTLNCDYNNYYASGVSGKLGSWGGTLVTTGHVIVTGQDVNSYAGSPVFSNAGGTNAVDYIPSPTISTLNGVTISGITTDFAGNTRVTPKMGAFESSFVSGIQNISGLTLTDNSALTVLNGAHLTIDASKTLNSITVERGGKLTNASGQTLTLTTLNLKSDASGTATYVDNGTSVITTGNVQQYLTGGRNWYISSPVASSARSVITNATTVYKFNEPTLAWQTESTSLTPMIGYIATTNTTGTSTFTGGALNTGSQTLSNLAWSAADATKKGFNLIGNPYPSYIDWEQTTKTGLSTTMWYRSRNSGNTAYVFDTYNGTSHEGTSLNGSIVTQFIPPMQAFWVRATSATNTFSATNNMRSHESGTNRLKAKAVDSQQVLRLRVSNNVNSDETLVLFNQNALNGFDDYDSPKMSNNTVSIPEIYTQIGDQKLVMNGMNVVKYETEILLGFATGEANNFSITNTQMANFDTGTKLILKDKLLSTEKDLTDGSPYDFESGVTNTNDRFSLIFRAQGTSTGIDNVEKGNTQAFVNSANKITIIAPEKSNYAIYNAVGQLIENGVTTSNHQTSTFNLQPGVYMVRVNNQSTRVIVK